MSSSQKLAATRILFFSLLFILTAKQRYFELWGSVPAEFWFPNGLTSFASGPFLDHEQLSLLTHLWRFSFLPVILGWKFRIFGPLNFFTGFIVVNYAHSFGYQTHTYMPLVLASLPICFSRASDSWSLDSRRGSSGELPQNQKGYNLALFNLKLVFCLVFFAAGTSKIINGGWNWVAGETLRNYFINSSRIYFDVHPLAHFVKLNLILAQWPILCKLLAMLAIGIEVLSPLSLFHKRFARFLIPALLIMQVVIYFTIYVNFSSYLALYAIWIPELISITRLKSRVSKMMHLAQPT